MFQLQLAGVGAYCGGLPHSLLYAHLLRSLYYVRLSVRTLCPELEVIETVFILARFHFDQPTHRQLITYNLINIQEYLSCPVPCRCSLKEQRHLSASARSSWQQKVSPKIQPAR